MCECDILVQRSCSIPCDVVNLIFLFIIIMEMLGINFKSLYMPLVNDDEVAFI